MRKISFKLTTQEIARVAVLVSLMIATAAVEIPTYSGVPITLQTFFVLAIGLLLKPSLAFLSLLVYLVMGFCGLPVFSGFSGGTASFFGPAGGFLISFPIAAFVISVMRTLFGDNLVKYLIYSFIGTVLIYMIGTIQMANYFEIKYISAMKYNVPYLLGDFIKLIGASFVAIGVQRHLEYINIKG